MEILPTATLASRVYQHRRCEHGLYDTPFPHTLHMSGIGQNSYYGDNPGLTPIHYGPHAVAKGGHDNGLSQFRAFYCGSCAPYVQ
jgi:hypothetical protein